MRNLSTVICALLLSLCTGFVSFGKGVDENTAKAIGSNFLVSNGIGQVQSPSDLVIAYKATAIVKGATIIDYYVFNFKTGLGFVMVAGDDVIEPILAYSNEAAFDHEKMSPSAKDWVEGYQNQITYVLEHNLVAQEGVSDAWSSLKVATKPLSGARTTVTFPSSTVHLLTTTWDQAPYYNYLCPGSGSSKAVTGCVATAMAQVMKFWNWPTVGTGLHTYTPASYSAQTANFGNTAYNWTGMPNNVTNNNNAVGTLMLHCGISVDMNYGAASSGAYVIHEFSPLLNCSEYAFKTYFRYKPTLKGLSRSATASGTPAINQTAWINYLKTELDANRPVMYSGQGTSGGHAWVADGYDASSKMHFNWGWGGTGPDGYYTVNAIAPPSLGIGGGGGNFNSQQCIIIGVMPDSFPSTPGNIKMLSRLNCTTSSPMLYKSAFGVTCKILNTNTTSFSGDFCAQVFDVAGNYMGTMQTLSGQTIAAGDSTATLTFSTSGMQSMIPGTLPNPPSYYLAIVANYGIRVMYRTSSSSPWTAVANNNAFINFNQMGVIGQNEDIQLYDSLHVGSHTISKGSALSITTKFANYGTSAFSGSIQANLINIVTGNSYPVQLQTGKFIGAGAITSSQTYSTSAITAPGGTYILAMQHQPGGSGPFITTGSDLYQNPIIINVIAGVEINTPKMEADKINIYPNPASSELFIDLAGAEVNAIHIFDVSGREVRTVTGMDNRQLVSIPVVDLAAGVYLVQLKSYDAVVTKKIVVAK